MKQITVVQHSSGGNAMKLEVALVHCIGASSTAGTEGTVVVQPSNIKLRCSGKNMTVLVQPMHASFLAWRGSLCQSSVF